MLMKLFVTAAAAAAVSVPLAGVAWAEPPSEPGNGGGLGPGGAPQEAGSYFNTVSDANPSLPDLNPSGGPIAPGSVFSTIAKMDGNTPEAAADFVNTIYGAYGTPETGGVPVDSNFDVVRPGLAVKTFTPACLRGRTATSPAINEGKSVCH